MGLACNASKSSDVISVPCHNLLDKNVARSSAADEVVVVVVVFMMIVRSRFVECGMREEGIEIESIKSIKSNSQPEEE